MPGNKIYLALAAALLAVALSPEAHAWGAAGARGAAFGGGGAGVAYGSRGGSAAWSHGTGVATGANGGSAAWTHGTAAVTGPQGNTAAWHRSGDYYGGYHPPAAYRPPVAYPVPVYGGGGYTSGQVAGAAVAGMAVGAMAGAAAASSRQPSSSTTVVVQESPGSSQMPIGSQVTVLPGNCGSATVGGVEYYQCGPNWFKPYFGNSSVYYKVVAAPY